MIYLEKAPSDLFSNNFMGAIELPTLSDKTTNFEGKIANISGFGKVKDNQQSNVLRWAQAPITSNAKCSLYFGDAIKNTNICISTIAKKSTCSGDSGKYLLNFSGFILKFIQLCLLGGPLTVLIRNKPTLVGITSFGSALGCANKAPAAFTRVTEYLNWISNQFEKFS
jgi:chymotrypsin